MNHRKDNVNTNLNLKSLMILLGKLRPEDLKMKQLKLEFIRETWKGKLSGQLKNNNDKWKKNIIDNQMPTLTQEQKTKFLNLGLFGVGNMKVSQIDRQT